MEASVLLVDDEIDFTTVLSERLTNRGLAVFTASSGEAALEQIQGRYFDAVVLDLAMPGMDGIETLRQLMLRNPDLQVMLLTGRATLEKGIEAVKLGAVEFLEKPVKIDLLIEKIYKAQLRRLQLNEKRAEKTMSEIMKRKGW